VHPTEASLLALVHGELDGRAAAAIRTHLSGCAECAAIETALRREDADVGALLRVLDHPVPSRSTPALPTPRFRFRNPALAASLALLLAGVAAAAVPGTALNRWVRGRLEGAPPTAPRAAPSVPTTAPTAPGQAAGGIEIPTPRALVLAFALPEPDGMLTVRTTDRADAALRAYGGDVAYEVADGRIQVDNRRPARRYMLEVPAALGRLTVLVADRPVFDSAERPLGPTPDSISLAPASER
jgi:anti-sigma factor RsiW